MTRFYFYCTRCRKRMRRFSDDAEGGRRFYFCECENLQTFFPGHNAASEGWPKNIMEQAVAQGAIKDDM